MDKFNVKHLIFLMAGVGIVSMKTYPRTFIANGQRDSWIAIILSSVVIFTFFLFMISVWKKSDRKSMPQIYQQALGKRLGNFFVFLFAFTLFLTLIECAAVVADSMHEIILLDTPKWFFGLFFVASMAYVVSRGLVAIIITTIIGIVLISIAGMILGFLVTPAWEFDMLLPILEGGWTKGLFIATIESLGLYGCISIVLPYLSKIQDKKNHMSRYVVIGLIFITQMQIVSILGILTSFEVERAASMSYPKLLQSQLIGYMQFLDFGELSVLLQMPGGWFLKYVISFFGILILLRDYKVKRKYMKHVIIGGSLLVYLGSLLAGRDAFVLFELLNVYQYICLFNFVLVPFLVFLILWIKIKGRERRRKRIRK